VAIYRLLREASFGPEEIERMTAAYEAALKLLRLSDRTDPITELVAQKIIEAVRKGEHDPARICTCVMENLAVSVPESVPSRNSTDRMTDRAMSAPLTAQLGKPA
jgi:hypothetical protein